MEKSKIFIVVIIALMGLASCAHGKAGRVDEPILTLINATIIDGIDMEPIEHGMVIVQGELIHYAGPMDDSLIRNDSMVIDIDGATLLPGLINTHIHQGFDTKVLQDFAQAGVTTVRDLQNAEPESLNEWSWFEQRDLLQEATENSRLITVGPMLTVPQGYPVYMNAFLEAMGEPITEQAVELKDIQHAMEVTERLAQSGADAIKIAIENGVTYLTPETLGYRLPLPSEEMLKAIVDIANNYSIPVVGHITNSEDIPIFLAAGGHQIAHMVVDQGLSDEIIQALVESDIIWIPTMELWNYVERSLYVTDFPDYQTFDPALENLKRFIAAGGKVALGTDFAGMDQQFMPPGESFQYMPIFELETMVDAGMTPMEALHTATIYAAEACNIADSLGTIRVGMTADILVVRGNPLEDFNSLLEPLLVLRNGIIIRNELEN